MDTSDLPWNNPDLAWHSKEDTQAPSNLTVRADPSDIDPRVRPRLMTIIPEMASQIMKKLNPEDAVNLALTYSGFRNWLYSSSDTIRDTLNGISDENVMGYARKFPYTPIPPPSFVLEAFLKHSAHLKIPERTQLLTILAQVGDNNLQGRILTDHVTEENLPDQATEGDDSLLYSGRQEVLKKLAIHSNDKIRRDILTHHVGEILNAVVNKNHPLQKHLPELPKEFNRENDIDLKFHDNGCELTQGTFTHIIDKENIAFTACDRQLRSHENERVSLLKELTRHGNDKIQENIFDNYISEKNIPNKTYRYEILRIFAEQGNLDIQSKLLERLKMESNKVGSEELADRGISFPSLEHAAVGEASGVAERLAGSDPLEVSIEPLEKHTSLVVNETQREQLIQLLVRNGKSTKMRNDALIEAKKFRAWSLGLLLQDLTSNEKNSPVKLVFVNNSEMKDQATQTEPPADSTAETISDAQRDISQQLRAGSTASTPSSPIKEEPPSYRQATTASAARAAASAARRGPKSSTIPSKRGGR